MKKLLAGAAGAMVLVSFGALAQSPAIGQRQAIFKEFGAATREPGQMLRDQAPFDLAKVRAALATYKSGAARLPALFPEDSKTGGDTKALPIIWEQKDQFNALFAKLVADATAAEAAITNEATFKTEMPKVLASCGTSCHGTYRAR